MDPKCIRMDPYASVWICVHPQCIRIPFLIRLISNSAALRPIRNELSVGLGCVGKEMRRYRATPKQPNRFLSRHPTHLPISSKHFFFVCIKIWSPCSKIAFLRFSHFFECSCIFSRSLPEGAPPCRAYVNGPLASWPPTQMPPSHLDHPATQPARGS